jgi:hypothetical protein
MLMSKNRSILTVLLLVTFVSGCAKNTITLSVDLYGEDVPAAIVPSQQELASYQSNLSTLSAEVDQLVADRKLLARQLYQTNQAILNFITKAKTGDPNKNADEEAAAAGEKMLSEYERVVEAKGEEVKRLIEEASLAVRSLLAMPEEPANQSANLRLLKIQQVSQIRVSQRLQDVVSSATELAGPLHTDFEKWLVAQWGNIVTSVSEQNLAEWLTPARAKPLGGEFAKLRNRARVLADTIEAVSRRGRTVAARAQRQLIELSSQEATDSEAMQRNLRQFAAAATAVPASPGFPDRGVVALANLSSLFDQVDRLQDPADPAWRIVSAKTNEKKWGLAFTRTYFYAEGKSSTVIVRDTPTSFRVQNGRNNPAALIKGQLEITRAVANAAIAIAGAVSGTPVPSLNVPANAASKTGTSTAASSTDDPSELSRRKAKVAKEAELRRQAMRHFARALSDIRDELQSLKADAQGNLTPEDETKRKALLLRLQSVLSGHQDIFKEDSTAGTTP